MKAIFAFRSFSNDTDLQMYLFKNARSNVRFGILRIVLGYKSISVRIEFSNNVACITVLYEA